MKHVYTARDAMDANFLRGLLEQEGLKATVQGENLQETWGTLSLSAENLPSVWVDDADEEKAAPIVERYRETDRANADDRQVDAPREVEVAQCGEMVEEQFDRCWKCSHPRGDGTALA